MKIPFILFVFISQFWLTANAQDEGLGTIKFKATGDEVAQPYFQKGLLLLHNFEYEEAAEEFEMAQLLDPNFVMAYWGEAMCYNHPIWFQQDFEKGKGALFKLGIKKEERLAKAQTDLEKDFFSSLEQLYGEEGNYRERNELYLAALKEMYEKYPAEEEVMAFYALAILGTCYEGNESEKLSTASRVLQKLNATNGMHPGAMNYMIQLYDDPATAYKGREVAKAYAKNVTGSRYALHASSHIYLATGAWAEVVQRNELAWGATEAWVKKKKKSLEDRNYHARWWLFYGYLQQGKFEKALELLTIMNYELRYSRSERLRFHLAMMRGHYLVETGLWLSDASMLEIPTKGFNVSTKSMCFFVDGVVAVEKNDFPRVGWFLNQMTDQRMVEQQQKQGFNDYRQCNNSTIVRTEGLEQELKLAESMEWELKAILAMKQNKLDEAASHAKKATELVEDTRYEPGPPVVLKPAHELYGDILRAQGDHQKAIEQYDLSLQRAPNRSLSLLGKYLSLSRLGESSKAASIKEMLMVNWAEADEKALSMLQ